MNLMYLVLEYEDGAGISCLQNRPISQSLSGRILIFSRLSLLLAVSKNN